MNRPIKAWIYCILFLILSSCTRKIEYPATKTVDVVDDYHGTELSDPYRWLEDDNADDTIQWVETQNKVTFGYLKRIRQREKIRRRLTELWNYEKCGIPFKKAGSYFYRKNDGLQNQSVLYIQESLDAEPRVLLDPNKLSEDGTIALTNTAVSEDGKYLAYGLSSGGSDWREFHVLDIETGQKLDDHIQWIKFSETAWTKDGKGFYYARYQKPEDGKAMVQANLSQKVYYHRMGTKPDQDILIYEDKKHPKRRFYVSVTHDGKFLILFIRKSYSGNNRIYYMEIDKSKRGRIVKLIDEEDGRHTLIDNDGHIFYFRTDLNAPKGKIVAVDINRPQRSHWKEIIPEHSDPLSSISVINNRFVAVYMHDAHHQIKIFDKNGTFEKQLELPTLGTCYANGEKDDTEMFYMFYSFIQPPTIYRYDFNTDKSTVFHIPDVDFNPENFETKQLFYSSKDGTRIPMFISYKKGLELNRKNPTYLYGYGGFNVSLTPGFDISNFLWMEMGGIYAQPNLRGGGEYGEEWHQQGILENKQNVFDDFIAAAEYLMDEGYTCPEKLSIGGGSNGGLLVGACMTQRPELFGAAIPAVGVMDMLRYHEFTIGWSWAYDYGRSDNPDHFKFLYAYSPLHNLKHGVSYPATLVTTADHDDRVVPAHSFKFAAMLQKCHAGKAPVLIRIETRAGHGAGKPTSKRIEEQADMWAFLVKNLKINY